jgi:hypothetical protein
LVFNKKLLLQKQGDVQFNAFSAHLPAKIGFLRIFLWILLQSYLRIVCRKDAAEFFSFMAENSAGKFPADSKIRRKQLPTKVLAGNQNPQETCFLRIFDLKLQENPRVISKILVVIDWTHIFLIFSGT